MPHRGLKKVDFTQLEKMSEINIDSESVELLNILLLIFHTKLP